MVYPPLLQHRLPEYGAVHPVRVCKDTFYKPEWAIPQSGGILCCSYDLVWLNIPRSVRKCSIVACLPLFRKSIKIFPCLAIFICHTLRHLYAKGTFSSIHHPEISNLLLSFMTKFKNFIWRNSVKLLQQQCWPIFNVSWYIVFGCCSWTINLCMRTFMDLSFAW